MCSARRRRRRRVERRLGVLVFVLTRGGFDGESLESAATLGRLRESLRAFVLHVAATVRDLRPASLDDPVEVPVRASDRTEASLGVFARALGEPTRDAAVAPPRRHLRGRGAGREGGARRRAGIGTGVGSARDGARSGRGARAGGASATPETAKRSDGPIGRATTARDETRGRRANGSSRASSSRSASREASEAARGSSSDANDMSRTTRRARARVSRNSSAGCGHGQPDGHAATTRTGKPRARVLRLCLSARD